MIRLFALMLISVVSVSSYGSTLGRSEDNFFPEEIKIGTTIQCSTDDSVGFFGGNPKSASRFKGLNITLKKVDHKNIESDNFGCDLKDKLDDVRLIFMTLQKMYDPELEVSTYNRCYDISIDGGSGRKNDCQEIYSREYSAIECHDKTMDGFQISINTNANANKFIGKRGFVKSYDSILNLEVFVGSCQYSQ